MAKSETQKKDGIFKRIGNYFKSLKSEFKKIVWPTKRDIVRDTIVVLVLIAIVGAFIVVLDYAFAALLGLFYGNVS